LAQSQQEAFTPYLTHAIVSKLDMAFTVKQDVIKFQVTIDYAFFVKKMQGKYNFSSVKPVAQKIGLNDVVLGQRANVDKCI